MAGSTAVVHERSYCCSSGLLLLAQQASWFCSPVAFFLLFFLWLFLMGDRSQKLLCGALCSQMANTITTPPAQPVRSRISSNLYVILGSRVIKQNDTCTVYTLREAQSDSRGTHGAVVHTKSKRNKNKATSFDCEIGDFPIPHIRKAWCNKHFRSKRARTAFGTHSSSLKFYWYRSTLVILP